MFEVRQLTLHYLTMPLLRHFLFQQFGELMCARQSDQESPQQFLYCIIGCKGLQCVCLPLALPSFPVLCHNAQPLAFLSFVFCHLCFALFGFQTPLLASFFYFLDCAVFCLFKLHSQPPSVFLIVK